MSTGVRNASPILSVHPSPISCGQNILDTQFPATYTPYYKNEVIINQFNCLSPKGATTMTKKYHRYLCIVFVVLLCMSFNPESRAEKADDEQVAEEVMKLLEFADGLAGVCLNGYWGFIDTAGKVAIKFIYKEIRSFQGNYAPARVDKRWGYIDKNGKYVINPKFDDARHFSEGLAPVKKGNLWGFIDSKGDMVMDYAYEDLKAFNGGLAPAKRVGKWGFINQKGKYVLSRQWLEAGEFAEDLAPVKNLENQWGYINRKGKYVIDPQFENAAEFQNGLAPVLEETQWGFINKKGKFQINPQYENARPFSEKLSAVKQGGKWGYIDTKGNETISFQFDEPGNFMESHALVVKDGEAYFINKKGEKALKVTARLKAAVDGKAAQNLTGCSDAPLSCYAFCNDGVKKIDTKVGQCYNARKRQCEVEQCSNPGQRVINTCQNASAAYDRSCVPLWGNFWSNWWALRLE